MSFLKDEQELQECTLESAGLIVAAGVSEYQAMAAAVFNRLGGLLRQLAGKTGIEPANIVAVWLVESGGRPFNSKRAAIRVEAHQFFEAWGKRNHQEFDAHFRFGGHNLQPGHPWENQEFRTEDRGTFSSIHHNQKSEYAALTLAQVLAGDETALRCASIGGGHITMNAYSMLGYESARAMYDAFQMSERAHVLGFLDFCRAKPAPKVADLIGYLKVRDWANFAKFYNGPGQVATYSQKLQATYEAASGLLNVRDAA